MATGKSILDLLICLDEAVFEASSWVELSSSLVGDHDPDGPLWPCLMGLQLRRIEAVVADLQLQCRQLPQLQGEVQ